MVQLKKKCYRTLKIWFSIKHHFGITKKELISHLIKPTNIRLLYSLEGQRVQLKMVTITTTKMRILVQIHFYFYFFFLFIFFFSSYNVWKHVRYPVLIGRQPGGDNTVSVPEGGTATPGTTKQLLPPDRVLRESYIYI